MTNSNYSSVEEKKIFYILVYPEGFFLRQIYPDGFFDWIMLNRETLRI